MIDYIYNMNSLQSYNCFEIENWRKIGEKLYIYGLNQYRPNSRVARFIAPNLTDQDIRNPCLAEHVHCEPKVKYNMRANIWSMEYFMWYVQYRH